MLDSHSAFANQIAQNERPKYLICNKVHLIIRVGPCVPWKYEHRHSSFLYWNNTNNVHFYHRFLFLNTLSSQHSFTVILSLWVHVNIYVVCDYQCELFSPLSHHGNLLHAYKHKLLYMYFNFFGFIGRELPNLLTWRIQVAHSADIKGKRVLEEPSVKRNLSGIPL